MTSARLWINRVAHAGFIGVCFFCAPLVMAQSTDAGIEALLESADQAAKETAVESFPAPSFLSKGKLLHRQEDHRFILLMSIMIMTVIVIGLVLFFLTRQDYPAESLISIVGLVLVVQATSFIVVASLTSEQLTTAIGVLGAIAGYLFGSANRSARPSKEAPKT